MFKGAIVGCGNVACYGHLPAWQGTDDFRLIAAMDPNPSHLERVQASMPGLRGYTDLDAMLTCEDLDFIDVCTPPAMHSDIIIRACTRGLHVLCEKPLAFSMQAYQCIMTAATTTHVVVFPVHNWKYAPLFQTVKRCLMAGDIGTPCYVSLTTLRTQAAGTDAWRLDPSIAGGGILLDHGWHAFYLLHFLLGEYPSEITATTKQCHLLHAAVEDTATCDLIFPHSRARIHLTWAAAQRRNLGLIRADQGEIHMLDDHIVVQRPSRHPVHLSFPQALSTGSYHPDWFALLLPDFLAALSTPHVQNMGLQEAELCLRLTLLAYQSAARNATLLSCL